MERSAQTFFNDRMVERKRERFVDAQPQLYGPCEQMAEMFRLRP